LDFVTFIETKNKKGGRRRGEREGERPGRKGEEQGDAPYNLKLLMFASVRKKERRKKKKGGVAKKERTTKGKVKFTDGVSNAIALREREEGKEKREEGGGAVEERERWNDVDMCSSPRLGLAPRGGKERKGKGLDKEIRAGHPAMWIAVCLADCKKRGGGRRRMDAKGKLVKKERRETAVG